MISHLELHTPVDGLPGSRFLRTCKDDNQNCSAPPSVNYFANAAWYEALQAADAAIRDVDGQVGGSEQLAGESRDDAQANQDSKPSPLFNESSNFISGCW